MEEKEEVKFAAIFLAAWLMTDAEISCRPGSLSTQVSQSGRLVDRFARNLRPIVAAFHQDERPIDNHFNQHVPPLPLRPL